LEARSEDRLVRDGKLQSGIVLPSVRRELIEGLCPEDVHPNARKAIEAYYGEDIWKSNS
jgi:hypothetical protein